MNSILFVTNLFPFPLDNGGKIKTYNILKALSMNYKIDLVCFINDKDDYKYVKNVNFIRDEKIVIKKIIRSTSIKQFLIDYIRSLFSINPYSVSKFHNLKLSRIIINELQAHRYKYIYIDHLSMMVYYKLFREQKVILDEHNVESLIFKRMIDTINNPLKKILANFEYYKLKKFEERSLLNSEKVICLSLGDKNGLLKINPDIKNKVSILPIHLDIEQLPAHPKTLTNITNILFMGSMSWYPNQQGIKWFMDNVWIKLDKEKYQIYIVGSNPPPYIKQYRNNTNVHVTGYVNSIDKYIKMCDINIVPLFIGSGQRVKIIESFAKGIPVISTTIGAEGLEYKDGHDILIADNAVDFKNKLQKLAHNSSLLTRLSENARSNFEKNYSARLLPDKLSRILS